MSWSPANHSDWCNLTKAQLDAIPTPKTDICPTASLVARFAQGDDKPSGTSDNAFGQGTKEDTCTIVVGP